MSRLTRDGTAEPVSRDQILRHVRGQGNINFPCSADHEEDWQPCPVNPYSAISYDHTYIHTCMYQFLCLSFSTPAIIISNMCYTHSSIGGENREQHTYMIMCDTDSIGGNQ